MTVMAYAKSALNLRNANFRNVLIRLIALISVLGFAYLFISLRSLGSRDRPEAFFEIQSSEDTASDAVRNKMALGFEPIDSQDGVNHHSILLESDTAGPLLKSEKIGLLMVCNWTPAEIISAEIVFVEKATGKITARYLARHGALIQENRVLMFKRSSSPIPSSTQESQNVVVNIISRGAPALAVMGLFSGGEPASRLLWMHTTSREGKPGVASVFGWYNISAHGEILSRAQMIAYTWGWGTGGYWNVYLWVFGAVGTWILGVISWMQTSKKISTKQCGLWIAAGTSLLFLSLGMVYVVIIPPFQTPDEPNHFLTYANVINKPNLSDDALKTANNGHFERIHFQTDEKFSSRDVANPTREKWDKNVCLTNLNRSLIAKLLWEIESKYIDENNSGNAIFALRTFNILFVSLCIGIALVLAGLALNPARISLFMVIPLICTPSLAFFSVGVSNYPFLIGGCIIQSIALAVLWAQSVENSNSREFNLISGVLTGFGIMLSIYSADSGVLVIAFWGVLIPCTWVIKGVLSDNLHNNIKNLSVFLIGLIGSMFISWQCFGLILGNYHIMPIMIESYINKIGMPFPLKYLGVTLVSIIGAASGIIAMSYSALIIGFFIKSSVIIRVAKRSLVSLVILGIIYLIFSKNARIPEFTESTAFVYAFRVLHSFFKGFISYNPDWLVVQSFWGVFGWLDTPMPLILMNIIRFACVIGIGSLCFSSIHKANLIHGNTFLIVNIFSIAAYLYVIALGYYVMQYGIHGRYLIGPYLFALVIAYEGYRRIFLKLNIPQSREYLYLVISVSIICMLIQCTAWLSILNRYY